MIPVMAAPVPAPFVSCAVRAEHNRAGTRNYVLHVTNDPCGRPVEAAVQCEYKVTGTRTFTWHYSESVRHGGESVRAGCGDASVEIVKWGDRWHRVKCASFASVAESCVRHPVWQLVIIGKRAVK